MNTSSTKWWKSKKLFAALALGAGLVCYVVPESLQGPCHLCARVVGVLVGVP